MSAEIESKVSEILAKAGITFAAIYMGETKNALGGNTPMDKWSCSFTKGDGRAAHEEFDYFTGLGHRKTVRGFKAMGMSGAEHIKGNWQATKPVPPHAAGVLHSLILDSAACDQSFNAWCEDFGYDNDSRKAENTYRACQENADKLFRVFSRAEISELNESLQDY